MERAIGSLADLKDIVSVSGRNPNDEEIQLVPERIVISLIA